MTRVEHEIVAKLTARSTHRPRATEDHVVLDGDRRRPLELEVVTLAPAAEINMMAVVPPHFYVARVADVNSDARADQHVAVLVGRAADDPVFHTGELDEARAHVVSRKHFFTGRTAAEGDGRKRVRRSGLLADRKSRVRAEGVAPNRGSRGASQRKSQAIAGVEARVLDRERAAGRDVDARFRGVAAACQLENVDV